MNAYEHLVAGEKALDGAKEMIKLAEAEPVGVVGLSTRRAEYLDKGAVLLSVASVHASLGRLARALPSGSANEP